MDQGTLKELCDIANGPFERVKAWKSKTGKRIIGSTLADVPEELVHAAGLLPFTILGTNLPIRQAASQLPDNCCSLDRSNLELVQTYAKDFFSGFVLPQVDDTSQHLSDIWRRSVASDYFESFLVPRQVNRPSARSWLRDEMERLKGSLESYTGRTITDEALRNSIRIYNENRGMLRDLYERTVRSPELLTNRQRFEAIKSSMAFPKEEHNDLLRRLLSSLPESEASPGTRRSERGSSSPLRLILSGMVWEPPEILSILDESGALIVGDDLCEGTRYIEADVPVAGHPLDALVERHFRKGPYSPIHDEGDKILNNLLRLTRERKADGILFIHIKFNESQDYDLPDLRKALDREGIPMLVLDTEFQTTHLAQTKTRIQAFLESLPARPASRKERG
jgi:bcr-type benzoyl-CoA reductase subunit C